MKVFFPVLVPARTRLLSQTVDFESDGVKENSLCVYIDLPWLLVVPWSRLSAVEVLAKYDSQPSVLKAFVTFSRIQ